MSIELYIHPPSSLNQRGTSLKDYILACLHPYLLLNLAIIIASLIIIIIMHACMETQSLRYWYTMYGISPCFILSSLPRGMLDTMTALLQL